jgi:glycosyltransferase involved in cell wall biosynthesis
MRIAIDALPLTDLSGRQVLIGHLRNLAAAALGRHSFVVLHHAGDVELPRDLGANVAWVGVHSAGRHWAWRTLWEVLCLRRHLRALGAGLLISTSGALVPRAGVAQWVLAPNAWCFFPQAQRGVGARLKARLQRLGYRWAQRRAAAVYYVSDFLAEAYRRNAGSAAARSATIHVGVDESLFDAGALAPPFAERALEIVAVSVMALHKAIEDLVDVLAALHGRAVPARLVLVGGWPDSGYRARIEARVAAAGLAAHVAYTGAVPAPALIAHYQRARVFCLLSRCESFGIPAIEAQAAGTPCVVPAGGAPAEVAGPGATLVPAGDVEASAEALARLLTDEAAWQQAAAAARANAERFRWSRLSQPILRMLDELPA